MATPCQCPGKDSSGNCTRARIGEPWTRGRDCAFAWHQLNPSSGTPFDNPGMPPCRFFGEPTGETRLCPSCTGRVELKLFACGVHGVCTPGKPGKPADGVANCNGCPQRETKNFSVAEWVQKLTSPDLIPEAKWYHAHQTEAVLALASRIRETLPPVPQFHQERGVVTSGGGKYWPGAWVQASILRALGWVHPIQVWYLGEREYDEKWIARLTALGARCIDAVAFRSQHPYRVLNGFELKLYAVAWSGIEQPLWLDSDCYPVRHPVLLYQCPDYRQTGSVHYPDRPDTEAWTKWEQWGILPDGSPPLETGQYLYHLGTCWEEVRLALAFNAMSDLTYKWDYGDKGPARVAWALTGRDRTIYERVPKWSGPAFIHVGPDGLPLFVHRVRGKAGGGSFYTPQNPDGQSVHPQLPGEALYQYFASRVADGVESGCNGQ